jgi:hypothetical protein
MTSTTTSRLHRSGWAAALAAGVLASIGIVGGDVPTSVVAGNTLTHLPAAPTLQPVATTAVRTTTATLRGTRRSTADASPRLVVSTRSAPPGSASPTALPTSEV